MARANKEGRKARGKGRFRPVYDSFLKAEGTGLETLTDFSENQGVAQVGDTKSDTIAEFIQIDATDWASLQIVKIAWPHLEQKHKQQILDIIRRLAVVTH